MNGKIGKRSIKNRIYDYLIRKAEAILFYKFFATIFIFLHKVYFAFI